MPALNSLPEIRQSLQSLLWRIAGDQPGIDSANGCPNDPVGLDAGLVQCLVDTDLIRAERAAPCRTSTTCALILRRNSSTAGCGSCRVPMSRCITRMFIAILALLAHHPARKWGGQLGARIVTGALTLGKCRVASVSMQQGYGRGLAVNF